MNSKRLYFLLIGVVGVLAAGLIGGAYGANVLLERQSKQLVQARLQSQALDKQQQQLSAAKADIAKYASLAAITDSVVPQDKDQATTVLELVNIANQYGIKIGSVTFPSSTLGASASGSGGGGVGASSAPANAGSALSQVKPVTDLKGVYDLQITIQSDPATPVPYSRFLDFLGALEHNRRTALVSGITLQPDSKNSNAVTFTLVIDEYIKP